MAPAPFHIFDCVDDTRPVFSGEGRRAYAHCANMNEINFNQRGPFGGGRYYVSQELG